MGAPGRWICGLVVLSLGLASPTAGERELATLGPEAEVVGVPWSGQPGITETIEQILARERRSPRAPAGVLTVAEPELSLRDVPRAPNPDAPSVSQFPPLAEDAPGATEEILSPQTVGTKFLGISSADTAARPPDSMGDVGPAQVLVAANGRIKVWSRTGVLGGLNVSTDTFFDAVRNGFGTTDPQVQYDRLSGRWFVVMANVTTPNRILIAVSSGPTITNTSSFTFFQFQHDLVGPQPNSDTGAVADYPSLGVDKNALYIGVNVINATGTQFVGTTGFVVNKANLLAGTLTVTAFRQLTNVQTTNGPFAPQGVDNDNAQATEGYFVGVDALMFSRLDIRRVSNPGGTPSISGNLAITVPVTTFSILVPHLGMANPMRRLDALDDRLFAAAVTKNKLTGVVSLWTAHNIETNASGVGTVGGGRDAARWYEIRNLTTTPTLFQSGTLFDPSATNPRFFWIPSAVMSGQGHMALGSSTAGTSFRAEVAVAGRLAGDPAGTTQSATLAQTSATAYNLEVVDGQRWGDYSQTVVDPNDDMTMWTLQEYCNNTSSWGVAVVQLKAPAPASPSGASPSVVCQGASSLSVIVTGTSSSGSGFFDPGPDAGGPGFANHIGATVNGGVGVNGVSFQSPTQVTLDISTVAATAGTKHVTVTNPDGQLATGVNLLTVNPQPAAPAASNGGPVCEGATLQLQASTVPGATYGWTGPNGFTSAQQNPPIPGATPAASGMYSATVTVVGCTSPAGTTTATVIANGATCDDGQFCTTADICGGGTCAGGPRNCADADPCTLDSCDEAADACVHVTAPDGSSCEDGLFCTVSETCTGGVCGTASARNCADVNPCTADSCDEAGNVCLHDPVPLDGIPCEDGLFCTVGDACSAGACAAGPARDCADTNACTADGCDEAGNACMNDPAPLDGSACSDPEFCTVGETCSGGACGGGSPRDCADTNACTADSCDEVGNACVNDPVPLDETPCDDGFFCAIGEACSGGACAGGSPRGCADGNPCTADSCDEAGNVCVNDPAPLDESPCDDGLFCTVGETCSGGACGDGVPANCADTNPCTADSCNEAGDACAHDPDPLNGTACSDGVFCTMGEVCTGGFCGGGVTRDCADGNSCTVDTCDEAGDECANDPGPLDGNACDDGEACTTADVCSAGMCTGKPGSPPLEVDDDSVRAAKSGSTTTISWTAAPLATSHDVLRGLLNQLPVGRGNGDVGEACIADNIASSSTTDPLHPAAGGGFWYVVRGGNACGPGPYGYERRHGVPTVPRVSDTCP